jgi:hypothetical protein
LPKTYCGGSFVKKSRNLAKNSAPAPLLPDKIFGELLDAD